MRERLWLVLYLLASIRLSATFSLASIGWCRGLLLSGLGLVLQHCDLVLDIALLSYGPDLLAGADQRLFRLSSFC
jgi:hypothetical protein